MQGKVACHWGGIVKPSSFGRRAAVRLPCPWESDLSHRKSSGYPLWLSRKDCPLPALSFWPVRVSIVAHRVTPLEWLSVVAVFLTWPSVPGVLPGKCMDWSEGSPCFPSVSQGLNHSINVTIEEGCMGW